MLGNGAGGGACIVIIHVSFRCIEMSAAKVVNLLRVNNILCNYLSKITELGGEPYKFLHRKGTFPSFSVQELTTFVLSASPSCSRRAASWFAKDSFDMDEGQLLGSQRTALTWTKGSFLVRKGQL